MNQLATIFAALGTPTEEDWPGITKLPCYVEFESRPLLSVQQLELFRHSNPELLDLLAMCLRLNPNKRWTATQALQHKCLQGLRESEQEQSMKMEVV